MTELEISQRNLAAAIKFVNEQSEEYELDDYGAGICTTYIQKLLNDISLRGLDFNDFHFQILSERFDSICADYQAEGIMTAYPDNAAEICRNAVGAAILTLKAMRKIGLYKPRRFLRKRQLVKALFLLPKDMRKQRENQLLKGKNI